MRAGMVPVPELVGHGEGQREASVLVDVAAAVWLAHACHMRQAQGFAGMVHGCTQVLPAWREAAFRLTGPGLKEAEEGPLLTWMEEARMPLPPLHDIRTLGQYSGHLGCRCPCVHTIPWTPIWVWGADLCLEQF